MTCLLGVENPDHLIRKCWYILSLPPQNTYLFITDDEANYTVSPCMLTEAGLHVNVEKKQH